MMSASLAASIPAGSWIVPDESDMVTTRAPSWVSFSVAKVATFPLPETAAVAPSRSSPMSSAM